ncbi:hypothetical protein U9M48_012222 [Paspalum notatum var. saurae]|uniref:Uncharacterized protein n=1 Tax=Paspalum notatum var. saurae TaxID=547442 RepID=A0AAQ3SX50_PASNO
MEGSAQTFLLNAVQLLREKYRRLHGVGGEVDELRDDLATMNALLRMQSEAEDGAVDHFVREWMKQVRELACDAEDCIDLYLLRVKCRPISHGVRAWLEHVFTTLFHRNRLAGEVRALRARATAISERHARYGGNREALRCRRFPSALAASASAHALRRAKDYPDEHHQLIGIGDQVDTVAQRLNDTEERSLKVFSIVGFGGLGKTTLAMEVCRRLEAEFPFQAVVSVSQAFEPSKDLKALLQHVLEQTVQPKTENERGIKKQTTDLGDLTALGDDKLATKLEEFLKDKRYLIVVDDVWTIQAFEAIQSKLPDNSCRSRIVVTTRIETVAKACSPASVSGHYYIHHMKPLDMEDSKRLFLSRAFGFVSASYPKELEDVMGNILKDCGGLPLAIVSIASILAGYRSSGSKDKWETVHRSIGFQMESNPTLEGMKHIITLSYNHLPHELKACMMYLSIFPEDYDIDKSRLLCRWIAEGLVPEKRGLTPMEVAESYLEELVSRNMIELRHGFSYYWKAESCRVHDMLLEVMVSRSLECNFVSLLVGQFAATSYGRIRRLSIQGDGVRRPKNEEKQRNKKSTGSGFMGMDVEHVRSLSIFHQGGKRILDHLDKFTLLRVLDLEDCKGLTNDHMRSICKLYLLRFLSLKGTDISQVPPQVEKLEHLQTLDVRDTPVKGLPETVNKLYKLERLQISYNNDANCMWRLPPGLKKMKALREVGFSVLGNHLQVARDVGELEQLRELVVYVDDIGFDKDVLEELAKSLSKSYSLRHLIIGDVGYGETLNFLHGLPAPPRLLRYLMIGGGISGLPPWIGSLAYLVQFNMSWGKLVGDQLFGVLCELPSLKTIVIQNMCYVDYELVARTNHRFPELSNLRIASGSPFPIVIRFEKESMAKLEKLLVNFSDNDEKRIVGIEHLTSLKEVQLWGDKNNPALGRALEQLKGENARRCLESNNQFQVIVKYSLQ